MYFGYLRNINESEMREGNSFGQEPYLFVRRLFSCAHPYKQFSCDWNIVLILHSRYIMERLFAVLVSHN